MPPNLQCLISRLDNGLRDFHTASPPIKLERAKERTKPPSNSAFMQQEHGSTVGTFIGPGFSLPMQGKPLGTISSIPGSLQACKDGSP